MDRLKQAWRNVRPRVLTGALFCVLRAIGATLRVKTEGFERSADPRIFGGWHGRSFVFANYFRRRGYWVIISQSRDGEIQAGIFRRLGYQIIRGSTGRGGVRAAVEGIRALKEGGTMALTPDGPRGPSQVVQGGIMLMAQKSGAPLIPVGISARPRLMVKSWDRYVFPIPFGKALLIAGEPIYVPKNATEEEVEALRLRFQEEICRLEQEAERRLGLFTPP